MMDSLGPPPKTFEGVRFALLGFEPQNERLVQSKLLEHGGADVGLHSHNYTHLIVDRITYEHPVCSAARKDGIMVVTALWVHHSFDVGMPLDAAAIIYRPVRQLNGIPGARSLVICLTGYSGQDRDDIMTMVGLMGAQFSKPLVASKVTHLICYKFEGQKYKLAEQMRKIKFVNHRWLLDCLRDWVLLPEDKYNQSGFELELMEAEARDSEDEAEDISIKQSVGRSMNKSCHNIQAGSPVPFRTSKSEVEVPMVPPSSLEKSIFGNQDKFDHASRFSDIHVSKKPSPQDACKLTDAMVAEHIDLHQTTPDSKMKDDMASTFGYAERSCHNTHAGSPIPFQTSKSEVEMPMVPPSSLEKSIFGNQDKFDHASRFSDIHVSKKPSPQDACKLTDATVAEHIDLHQTTPDSKMKDDMASTFGYAERSCHNIQAGSPIPFQTSKSEVEVPMVPPSSLEKSIFGNQDKFDHVSRFSDIHVSKKPSPQDACKLTDDTLAEHIDLHHTTPDSKMKDDMASTFGYAERSSPHSDRKLSYSRQSPWKSALPLYLADKSSFGSRSSKGPISKLSVNDEFACSSVRAEENAKIGFNCVEALFKGNHVQNEEESSGVLPQKKTPDHSYGSSKLQTTSDDVKTSIVRSPSSDTSFNEIPASLIHDENSLDKTMGRLTAGENLVGVVSPTKSSSFTNKSLACDEPSLVKQYAQGESVSMLVESTSKGDGAKGKWNNGKEHPLGGTNVKNSSAVTETENTEETEMEEEGLPLGESKCCGEPKSKPDDSSELKENKPIVFGVQNIIKAKEQAGKSNSKCNFTPMESNQKLARISRNSSIQEEKPTDGMKTQPEWFILSGHQFERKEFQKIIKRLKGRCCRDSHNWSYQATHFIIPEPIRRIEKFFAAAASGRWILKSDYLAASNQAGKFVAEEPYEWYKSGLSEDGTINLEAPRKWRHLRERTGHGAFHGMRIIIYGDCLAPRLDTLKRVVKAGDGTILATCPPYTRFLDSGVDFAIVSPGMPRVDMWVQEFLKHEIPCVVADYLVEYVCKPGYPLERHVLYNTHAWAEKSFGRLQNKAEEILVVVDKEGEEEEVNRTNTPKDDSGSSDIPCVVCRSFDRGEVMLICGNENGSVGCGIGTHIDCCSPPLEDIPEDDWFCPKCSSHSKANSNPSKKRKKGKNK